VIRTERLTAGLRGLTPAGVLEGGVHNWLWGWSAIALLTVDLVLAGFYLTLAALALVGIVLLPVFLIGFPLLAATLALALGAGYLERAKLQALTGIWIAAPNAPPKDRPLWRRVLLDPRPWRALLYLTVMAIWGLVAGVVILGLASVSLALVAVPFYAGALPAGRMHLPWNEGNDGIGGVWWFLLVFVIGVIGLLITPLLARVLILINVVLARWLLGPGRNEQVDRLSERVQTLTETREATVDSVETERRRIERDLHDGPQQRLVAIAMDLGMAQERMNRDPEGARQLLDKAHSAAKEAVTELRQVARGIHPPVLTDRGLDAALSALAARSPVPVTVSVQLPVRPSPTVEAIAYFCVSEALTNVAKHSRAGSAQVSVDLDEGQLQIEVRDDGVGGADPSGGTGLHGLADRVAAIDGSLQVDSPIGGPTVLTVLLPVKSPERS
jgi:signal transduction histidine kinase